MRLSRPHPEDPDMAARGSVRDVARTRQTRTLIQDGCRWFGDPGWKRIEAAFTTRRACFPNPLAGIHRSTVNRFDNNIGRHHDSFAPRLPIASMPSRQEGLGEPMRLL